MKRIVGLWVLCLGTTLSAIAQVDTSYIYNTNMSYGTLDLRLAKSPSRYYYLQEGVTFSYRESEPGVKSNTYTSMTTWNTSAYEEGNLREKNGASDNFAMNYRLLKPKGYNDAYADVYPIIVVFHGGGEAANCWIDERCHWSSASYNPVTNSPPAPATPNHKLLNNDRNLLHGGAQHLTAVNLAGTKLPNDPTLADRAFPGFVLFPQSLNGWGPTRMVEDAIRIVRLIIKKYNIDESRVYIHGLSNGGGGVYNALKRAPWLFAAALPMSAVNDGNIISHNMVGEVAKLPLWVFQGGQDSNPTPGRTYNYVRTFQDAGANVRYYLYPNLGHGTWNTAYREPDFFSWILQKRKYNPHIYYGEPIICNTTQTGARMAFSKGFFAYQWERNGQLLPGETGPEITANVPGTYRGRFSRKPNLAAADWERWSDPIVVTEKYPEKPAVDVLGTAHLRGPGLASTDENNTVRLRAAESAERYLWYRNGTPVNFPETSVDDTVRLARFMNASTAGNGPYTLVVKTSNCPSPASDPINLFFSDSSPLNMTLSSGALDLKGTIAASSIFLSWNDVTGAESGYEIWRRKAGTPDFQFVTKTREDAVSFHDINLDPGSTYEYKIRAVNNSGRSNYLPSDDLGVNYTFTTGGDFHFPPAPQNLKALDNTLNTITLSWEASRDESSIREYYVYYDNDSVSTGSRATTYTLGGLTQNKAYAVRVKAVDFGNHFSQASNQIIATTYLSGLVYKHSTGAWESLDDSAMVATWRTPEFIGTVPNFTLQPRTQDDYFNFQFTGYLNIETEGTYYFNISSDDGSRLFLNGNMIANNDGLHGTRTVASEGIYLTAGPHAIEVQYFDDINAHHLTVRYKGPGIGDGNTFVQIPDAALRSGVYIPPSPPAAPTGVTASAAGMQRIDIAWQFTDDGATDYEVYRATSTGGPWEVVIRAERTSASDSVGLIPGTPYYYRIKTVTKDGSSPYSQIAGASTASDNVAPTVPTGLTMVSKTLSNLAFTWNASTDNVAVAGYEIFAGDALIGTSAIHAFTAENLSSNSQYVFTVRAVDASGNRSAASQALVVGTNTGSTFYSLASGNLNELTTWRRNSDGTGESPANFSDNGQYFVIANRTVTSPGGAWTVGGAASRVAISDGVTFNADQPFSAIVELQGTAILNLNHVTGPDLAKLSPTSTVNFNGYTTVAANTYGNVILSGTVAKTFGPDTIRIVGNLTVSEGLALKGSPQNGSHIRISGTLALQGSRPETAGDNAVDLSFAGASTTISSGGDIHLYRLSAVAGQSIAVVNPSGNAIKIILGSLKGGGLLLANGSSLNINDHDLILKDAAVVNPGLQTGSIAASGGDLLFGSGTSQHSYLYFAPANHRVNLLTVDLGGAGNIIVRSPLQISQAIKIKNGTLASEGNITLLASGVIYEIENSGRITGDVTVQKTLAPKGNVYHYLSAPVSGVTVSEWQQSFPVAGSFSGASTAGSPSLFYYRGNTGGWVAYPPSGGSNTAAIERGVGYAARLTKTQESVLLSVNGTPFQGSVPYTLSAGGAGVSNDGWNLIGNPYASPVEWSAEEGAWTRSGVSNVMAIRSNTTVNGQVRSKVNYYDMRLGGGVIEAGQAFWVKTFTATPAMSILEKAKVDEEETSEPVPQVKHFVVNLVQGDVTDPAYILFSEQGSDGLDPQFDGRKMKNYGMFNLSTITADTVLLAINTVTNEFCSKTVNLNIADVSPGTYSFAFANLESIPEIGEIVLTDKFAGETTVITGSPYAFSVTSDPASFGRTRFSLKFTKDQLNVTTPQIEASDVCAPGPGIITIRNSQAGVSYQVVNAATQTISPVAVGTGETIELEILPAELVSGENTVRISAGFAGCDAQILPGEFTINYISALTVTTDPDISICDGADVTLQASGAPQGGFYQWFDSEGELIEGETQNTLHVTDVSNEAVFYVAAAHPNGCESDLASIHIYADTLEMPVVLMKDDTLYTETVGYYQWRIDGEDITGATLHYYVPAGSGYYTVIASNGGCYKESERFAFGDADGDGDPDSGPVTGTDNGNNQEFSLNIYPIPSSGHEINVLMRSPKTEPVLIEIIDAMGRTHFSRTIDAHILMQGTSITPYAPLYNGIYFIRATQAEIRARKKIVVKKD